MINSGRSLAKMSWTRSTARILTGSIDIVENTRRLRLSSAARGDTVSRLRRLAENLDNIGTMTLAAQNPNAQTPLPGYSTTDETRSSLVLHRLDRPQIGHDRIEQ
jgi:hypothetical protein